MTLDIDRRTAHYPDRTAVIDDTGDRRWSYADLDAETEAAAGRLHEADVSAGDRVVVLARIQPELIALLFGARRLGATLAPVSHRLGGDTVGVLADRIDPELLLFENRFADIVPDGCDAQRVSAFRERDPVKTPTRRPADVAEPLFLHTGGTTGVPKVVPITERQIVWNCITELAAWGLGADTVAPILLPLFHTGGWNLLTLPTLYVGGTVVLQRSFDPGETLAIVENHGATKLFGVAAILDAMADHPDFADADLSTLDWVMSGGGPTPEAVAEPYRERGVPFVRGYGLTEGGPNNLYLDPDRGVRKPESVGRPFPDCEARIVDADGEQVVQGAVGELQLRGPMTADRYLTTEDGTFDGDWVSTGDLVRQDEDGDYAVTGRVDNMFVSGGENVHPEAVESVLEEHDAVQAAGVVGVPHERWGTVPRAVLMVAPGDTDTPSVDADELASFAADRLAAYERPHEYVLVDELPRSGPGKIDRDALRTEDGAATDSDV
ncbi:MAG: class I adenylate-forming enzyme family protein [Halolamina sp.]